MLRQDSARLIWLPMWDNVANWPPSFWRSLPKNLRIVAFCAPIARLVITNDTSAHHIAAAVGAKTVCLSNGNTFGRFVPYPKEVNDTLRYAYPPEIEQNLHNFHEIVEKFKYASRIDINLIATVTVKGLIDELLSHKHER